MSVPAKAAARAAELHRLIEHHSYLYYIKDAPEVSDAEFDGLFRELQELEQAHPELASLDSPTQRVGARGQTDFAPVQHTLPMLSLSNALTEEEAAAFDRRVREGLVGLLCPLGRRNGRTVPGVTPSLAITCALRLKRYRNQPDRNVVTAGSTSGSRPRTRERHMAKAVLAPGPDDEFSPELLVTATPDEVPGAG